MTLMTRIRSRSEKSVFFKNNWKNKRKKNSCYLKKNVKRMKKCFLCKAITPVYSRKLIAWEKLWRSLEPNIKELNMKLVISLMSIINKNRSYLISLGARKKLSNLVIRSWVFFYLKMNCTNYIKDPNGMKKRVIGPFHSLPST